jgi:hypothetical protein
MNLAMKLESIDDETEPAGNTNNHSQNDKATGFTGKFTEDPFIPMDQAIIKRIIEFFGLTSGINHSNFFARSDGNRKCYFVSPAISRVLTCPQNNRLKIVHSGARCYERSRLRTQGPRYHCDYRVVQEGIDAISPFMTRQLLHPSYEQFISLLENDSLTLDYFRKLPPTDQFAHEALKGKNGCMVMRVKGGKISEMSTKPMALAVWRTDKSISMMTPKAEKASLMNLLGVKPVVKIAKETVATTAAQSGGVIDKSSVEATIEEVITETTEGPLDSNIVCETIDEVLKDAESVAE